MGPSIRSSDYDLFEKARLFFEPSKLVEQQGDTVTSADGLGEVVGGVTVSTGDRWRMSATVGVIM